MPADRPDDGHMDLVMTKTRQPPADPLRARGLAEERPADAAQADTTTATGAPAMDRHVGRRARRPMQSTCPDLAYRLGAIVLDEAKADAICNAPVAQKPTLTTKKQVHMLEDGAYKGPYDVNLQAEAVRVTRTLYREYVLSKLWGDTIVAHHVPVFDEARGVIYLRMDLVGDRGPGDWRTQTCTIRRGGQERQVSVVSRESHGLCLLSSMDVLASPAFVGAFPAVIVHMAARYLIGCGDANLNNILGCASRGAASVRAVDIEDNRDWNKRKRAHAEVAAGDGGASSQERPTISRCLFTQGRGPKDNERAFFSTLLSDHMPSLRTLIERVRASINNPTDGDPAGHLSGQPSDPTNSPSSMDEGIAAAAEYARQIGYEHMGAHELPTRAQIAARLDTLETCIDEFEQEPAI